MNEPGNFLPRMEGELSGFLLFLAWPTKELREKKMLWEKGLNNRPPNCLDAGKQDTLGAIPVL